MKIYIKNKTLYLVEKDSIIHWTVKQYIRYKLWELFVYFPKSIGWWISNKHWVGNNKNPHYFCYKKHLCWIGKTYGK